jgi:hypothetical protein
LVAQGFGCGGADGGDHGAVERGGEVKALGFGDLEQVRKLDGGGEKDQVELAAREAVDGFAQGGCVFGQFLNGDR